MPVDPILQRAAQTLSRAHPSQPADAVLREALAQNRRLSLMEKTAIARAVFATHRWQGWLSLGRPSPSASLTP